jgi:uncharacterized protein YaiE (UPF0345 family)
MSFASQSKIRVSRRAVVFAAALSICAVAATTNLAVTRASARFAFSPDKKGAGIVPDKGHFKIQVNGQAIGKEEFEIGSSGGGWMAHGHSEINTPKGVTKVTGTLTTRPDGYPEHYDWATQAEKKNSAAISFNTSVATAELHLEGQRPYTQEFTFNSPMVVVLDDNMYHQYQILAGVYDMEKKGAQTFQVLVPQELTPGTVTVEYMGKQDVDNKKMEALRVRTEDNEIDLYLDGGKLMRLVASGANAEVIRDKD